VLRAFFAIHASLSGFKISVKISPTQSDFLNWSRWVAAWLVVAEHARSLVFVDYGQMESPGLLAKGFYFLTGFGHEAVMVFFVISGYLVGGKVWSLYQEAQFEWRRYLADRLSRLYAVLLVALLLGAALDWTGYLFFNKYGLYNQGYEGAIAVLGTAPIERMGFWDFLVNAFFLQTIAGPPFGSNGPLWSLAYEWWYYILFPLVLAALWPIVDYGWRFFEGDRRTKIGDRGEEEILTTEDTERKEEGAGPCLDKPSGAAFSNPSTSQLARDCENTSPTRSASGPALPVTRYSLLVTRALSALGSLLAVAGLCWFLTWEILIFFGVWILGVIVGAWPSRHMFHVPLRVGRNVLLAGAVLVFIGALLVARGEFLKTPYAWQYLLGVAYALVIFSLAGCQWRLPGFRPSTYLADFSYSVYLIHFPVTMFFLSVGFEAFGFGIRMPFEALGLAWYFGIFFVALLMSWLVSLFTERKTAMLRRIFYSLLRVR
jgi:peptidoglycan/LPS O-acetylase OafA/YrhL